MKSFFDSMDERQLYFLAKQIADANPPPVLHRYRRPTEWTLKELSAPEIYVAGVDDMNDPLEFLAPFVIDQKKLTDRMYRYAREDLNLDHEKALIEAERIDEHAVNQLIEESEKQRKKSSIICASANPRSNQMWAYYAEAHKGVCIGYDTSLPPFAFAKSVNYEDPDTPFDFLGILQQDPTLLKGLVSCRKGADWAFEEEYRIPLGQIPAHLPRLLPVSQDSIIEIRLGVNIEKKFRDKVVHSVRDYDSPPRIYQMRVNTTSFSIDEHELHLT